MNISKFFTPADLQYILAFMSRAGGNLENEAMPYLAARQKVQSALNYLVAPKEPESNGDEQGSAEQSSNRAT